MEQALNLEFDVEVTHLLSSINFKYDCDFRNYSYNSMKRSVVHAMDRMGCDTVAVLEEKVLNDPERFEDLLQYLTNSASELFRDSSYFLSLREKVIPHLKTYPSIKVWVAGCATGEEVYSLAIILEEEELLERTTLYATDINSRSLEAAEKGVFGLDEIETAAQRYQKSGGKRALSDYYKVESASSSAAGSARFHSTLKKNVTFADHSLVTDAVFAEIHLISCRNVLLYLNNELQNRAIGLFHESLCRKGFLGLGSRETIQFSHYAKYFDYLVKSDRIFQNRG